MAEIQMVYRVGRCWMACYGTNYSMQCHTSVAADAGCRYFDEGKHAANEFPFGDCIFADFKFKYKGITTKNYEMEESEDPYNPHLNCMNVKIGRQIYPCEKVILNGKCVYDNLPSEEADGGVSLGTAYMREILEE